jgi:hypothetical protein
LAESDPQKLSKHLVADECVVFLEKQHARQQKAIQYFKAVLDERDELLTEINHWRGRAGIPPREPICADRTVLEDLESESLEPTYAQMHSPLSGGAVSARASFSAGQDIASPSNHIPHLDTGLLPNNIAPVGLADPVCEAGPPFPPSMPHEVLNDGSYYLNHFSDVLQAQQQVGAVLGQMGSSINGVEDEALLLSLAGCDDFDPTTYESADGNNIMGHAQVYLPT